MVDNSQHFSLIYTNYVAGYYTPGEKVEGRVELILDEPMKMRAVRVHVIGEAYVRKSKNNERVVYIDEEITLWGETKRTSTIFGEHHILAKGEYKWPFTFCIPTDCPSSFESGFVYSVIKMSEQDVYIRYQCEVHIYVII